jgi:hypothetical protein
MQSERITEVKDALLAAIDAIKKTSHVLKKASEQYYFHLRIVPMHSMKSLVG